MSLQCHVHISTRGEHTGVKGNDQQRRKLGHGNQNTNMVNSRSHGSNRACSSNCTHIILLVVSMVSHGHLTRGRKGAQTVCAIWLTAAESPTHQQTHLRPNTNSVCAQLHARRASASTNTKDTQRTCNTHHVFKLGGPQSKRSRVEWDVGQAPTTAALQERLRG